MGCGIGFGSNGVSTPLACSFSKASLKVVCNSEKFLQGLAIDDLWGLIALTLLSRVFIFLETRYSPLIMPLLIASST